MHSDSIVPIVTVRIVPTDSEASAYCDSIVPTDSEVPNVTA